MRGVVAFLLVTMITVGCATKVERARTDIQRTWRIEFVSENGQDVTEQYTSTRNNYRITFDNDNNFQEVYQQLVGGDEIAINGSWDFSDQATQLTLVDDNGTRIYQVDKLDEDELNVTDLSSNNDRMIQFVPS